MHFMSFALKRAHLRAVALVRAWHPGSPITAARFDILYAIQERHACWQSSIHRALGLSGATISRALKRLEELGLIVRNSVMSDRRRKSVALTRAGLAEFNRVLSEKLGRGLLHMAYERALGPHTDATWLYLDDSYRAVRAIARYFGDTAEYPYPTNHPDD